MFQKKTTFNFQRRLNHPTKVFTFLLISCYNFLKRQVFQQCIFCYLTNLSISCGKHMKLSIWLYLIKNFKLNKIEPKKNNLKNIYKINVFPKKTLYSTISTNIILRQYFAILRQHNSNSIGDPRKNMHCFSFEKRLLLSNKFYSKFSVKVVWKKPQIRSFKENVGNMAKIYQKFFLIRKMC